DRLGGVDDEAGDVHVLERVARGDVEPLPHEGAGLVDARGVDEHDLRVVAVEHAPDLVAGRLRLVGDDRHLLAEDPVEQGRLADVGPAHEGDEARPERHAPSLSASSWSRRTRRTRVTRCPSRRSTMRVAPSRSTESPGAGTRPSMPNTRPPRESQVPSGSSRSSSSLIASTLIAAFTSTSPLGRRSTFGDSTSNSSVISPTSSSSRSSRVTSPAVPPYSSTTIAMWVWRLCISASS